MLTRLYIDNFRCFVNFEYRPAPKQLILGGNGTGKSSLLDALLFVRQFVVRGDKADDLMILSQRTRWMNQPRQTFEMGAQLDGGAYAYRLLLEPLGDPPRLHVVDETVHVDGRPLFAFVNGEVQLYDDHFELKVAYPFDPNRSALATISPTRDNHKLTLFRQWLGRLYCFRLNPFAMRPAAEGEHLYPNVDLSNIAAWYRHLVQAFPEENAALLTSLREVLDGFSILQLETLPENHRVLIAKFSDDARRNVRFLFNELSDGQRCLVCLYALLHFVVAKGSTVIIDEPENFISLRELQPWLMSVTDAIEEGKGQVLLISHHPEFINQWAPSYGVQFVRDGAGPVRVEEFHGAPESTLTPAELIARGWETA